MTKNTTTETGNGVAVNSASRERRLARSPGAASIAARRVGNSAPEMTNVAERAEESNVTPLWPAAKAVDTIKRASDKGYFPITIMPHTMKHKSAGKIPSLFYRGSWGGWKDWETQVQIATLESLADWQGQSNSVPNVGILCGTQTVGGFLTGVDIDCKAPEIVDGIKALAGDTAIAIRKGRPERSGMIMLVVDELGDAEKFQCGGPENTIQLLREGKQFVAAGIHPDTKKPYRWEDADELPVAMPALAALPRVKMADLVHVLGEAGFHPASASASKPASGRKAELRAELEASELDADSFDELFVDEGAPFPLAELREKNPAFDRLYAKYENYVVTDDEDGPSHYGNRVATGKDFLREHPDTFKIEHAAVFCSKWPGAGERVEKRETKGQWDNDRQVNSFAAAEAAIKAEMAGEAKQHSSTKLGGAEFGAVIDEEDDEGNGAEADEAQRPAELKQAEPKQAKEKKSGDEDDNALKFEFEHDVAADAKLPDWLVEDLIETKTLAVFYGKPNHGKSLLLLDMLYHVAAGKQWRGRDVKKGCVLFISVEGPNGTARRAKAWRHFYKVAEDERLPMAFMRSGINLYKNGKDAQRIVDAVKRLEKQTGLPCRAIAIDTISATTPGMDQNSEMGVFIDRCRLILSGTTDASVIAVHHPGKNTAQGLRGDSNLIGAIDMTLLVDSGAATTEKMRDGVSGQQIAFKIHIEYLWKNDKGKPVGAPVAIECSMGEAMGSVQDSDDATATDTYDDKLIGALNALETCVEFKANAVNEDPEEVGVSSATVLIQLNKDRKRAGLPELKDRSIIPKLLAKLVSSKKATKTGENNRAAEYRLVY